MPSLAPRMHELACDRQQVFAKLVFGVVLAAELDQLVVQNRELSECLHPGFHSVCDLQALQRLQLGPVINDGRLFFNAGDVFLAVFECVIEIGPRHRGQLVLLMFAHSCQLSVKVFSIWRVEHRPWNTLHAPDAVQQFESLDGLILLALGPDLSFQGIVNLQPLR